MSSPNPETFPAPSIDLFSEETQNALAGFAGVATPKDANVMDELVRSWLNLARRPDGAGFADAGVAAKTRRDLRLKFMRLRFLARDCTSFRRLPPDDRNCISKALFEMPAEHGFRKPDSG